MTKEFNQKSGLVSVVVTAEQKEQKQQLKTTWKNIIQMGLLYRDVMYENKNMAKNIKSFQKMLNNE